jgi:hypothetical protein
MQITGIIGEYFLVKNILRKINKLKNLFQFKIINLKKR